MASVSRRLPPDFQRTALTSTKIWFSPIMVITLALALTTFAQSQSHLTISGSVPNGEVGIAYDGTVSASGGASPYHYSITSGALPQGLTLDGATGVISGIPQKSGRYSFEISAWDQNGIHGDKFLGMSVSAEGISVSISPTTASITSGGSQSFSASVRGTANTAVTWSATAGSISSSGNFTAPTTSSTISVKVTATSVADSSKHASAAVTVSPASSSSPSITTTSIPGGFAGISYAAGLSATGGTTPYSWSISSGALPSGITLASSSGLISGTTSVKGNFNFTAKVTDANGKAASQGLTLSITASSGSFDGPAELPRVYMQSALANTPAPGSTIAVPAGGNLQAALNSANCGDTITLQAGASYSGLFTLPAKSCDDLHWIIIRTSAPDTSLASEGTRISPCYAGVVSLPARPSFACSTASNVMAQIIYGGVGGGPLMLAPGANHYRLLGLEITRKAGTGFVGALLFATNGYAADHIVVDRSWVHGTTHDDTSNGFSVRGITYAAVVDSYLNDFHCAAMLTCTDSKAIGGGIGTLPGGPYKIVNNFLEAAGENILFGGGPATTIPADIEIRRNHFFKPLIWQQGRPGFVGGVNGKPFIVKNLFELKNAQRVLLEGNILENSWGGFSQFGFGIGLTPKNQVSVRQHANVCPICQVTDVTIRYSTISHTAGGIDIATVLSGLGGQAAAGARISVHDVTFDDINAAAFNGPGTLLLIMNGWPSNVLNSVSINHITGFGDPAHRVLGLMDIAANPKMWGITVTNSILGSGAQTIGSAAGGSTNCAYTGIPITSFNLCFTTYAFSHNAVIGSALGSRSSSWPAGNYFPTDPAAVQFTNFNNGNGGNYQLSASSPYKNAGSDGKDLGADIVMLNSVIAGVY